VGKKKILRKKYKGREGIFIVLKNINISSSLQPRLILLAIFHSGSSFKPLLIRILSVAFVVTNRC
jgi:hypothetical protein